MKLRLYQGGKEALGQQIQPKENVVPRRRLERPTCRLGGGCSIQLSYRGVGEGRYLQCNIVYIV